jgi:hypothetical protein
MLPAREPTAGVPLVTSTKIIPFPVQPRRQLPAESAEMAVALPVRPRTVTFLAPFTLPGMDKPHKPGTFELRETRRSLDVSWDAYQISLSIMLVEGGTTEALDVSLSDLDQALAGDRAKG